MAGANFDYERASRALATAAIEGDATATQTEGISARTLQRYRKLLQTDDALARLVTHKRALLEREWAHQIAPTLRAALDFIQRASTSLDPSDPEAVHAMAGAMKLTNEAGLALRMVDHRLAEVRGADADPPGQVLTASASARHPN